MPMENAPISENMLPVGTRIGEFEILSLIGEGGFGIVYLAYDHALQRQVALKEYMPSSLATRDKTAMVNVRSARDQSTFLAGLKSFVNEARLLAQFDHAALVKVHRFWESNGTAYMVMPFYEGVTLKDTLKKSGRAPTEEWLTNLLGPLLDALAFIHARQCFHRDIAPDNIMILKDGGPVLLDFGAARRVISDMTQVLTVILKPGYAPVEQYADVSNMKQGAWTDIYALAAVIYFAVTGRTPMPSVARLVSDGMAPLSQVAQGGFSTTFLAGIDRALSVKPEDRPQSIAEFRAAIGMSESGHLTQVVAPAPAASPPAVSDHDAFAETIPRPMFARDLAAGRVLQERPYPEFQVPSLAAPETPAMAAPEPAKASGSHMIFLIAATVVIVVLLGIAAYFLFSGNDNKGVAGASSAVTEKPQTAASPAITLSPTNPANALPGIAPSINGNSATGTNGQASTLSPPTLTQSPDLSTQPPINSGADTFPKAEPAPVPAPAKPAMQKPEPTPRQHAAPAATVPAPGEEPSPKIKADPAVCADLLQRASLGETLTPDEKALLRRSCR